MLITIGNTTIEAFEESKFALDGGAMFGIVPKMLWDREIPGDENNLITLAANIMLIRNTNFNILIEQGLGDKYSEREIEIYKIRRKTNQFDELKKRGLTRYDITHVVLTHLHFDHCGCATIKNGNGEIVPAFPNAKYYVQSLQFAEASSPHERNKGSYKPENFIPVIESGQMIFIDGDTEILPGIKALITNGHALGHQVIEIDIDDFKGVYVGDLIPTAHHVNLAWIMGYDLYPSDTLEMKKKLLPRYTSERRLVFFPHETRLFSGYIQYDEKRDRYKVQKYD
jgi:glyoxylase-like metal-dependent hydrolase (beta-lactamase superfamily II)